MKNKKKLSILIVLMLGLFLMKTNTTLFGQEIKATPAKSELVKKETQETTATESDEQGEATTESIVSTNELPNLLDVSPVFSPFSTSMTAKKSPGAMLLRNLFGEGVEITNQKVTGSDLSFGEFANGFDTIGIEEGIILSTGRATDVVGSNTTTRISSQLNTAGDSDIAAMVKEQTGTAYTTHDAAVLEFDFVPKGDNLRFEYVFGSEEYNYFVGGKFNDAFGYFLDGVNVALLPGTTTSVSINNVNGGNEGVTPNRPAVNPEYYRNNSVQDSPLRKTAIESQLNGLTTVLSVNTKLVPNKKYHMKLAVADVQDMQMDTAVFIKARSFTSSYVVNYQAGDGVGTPPVDGQAVLNEDYTIASPTNLSKPGYIFSGWKSSVNGVTYQAGEVVKLSEATTYTAQWKLNTFNVSYALGGGSGTLPSTASYEVGKTVTLASATGITRDKYRFIGWRSSANNTVYQPGQTFVMSQEVILTAEWELAPTTGRVNFVYKDTKGNLIVPPVGVIVPANPDTQPINNNVKYAIPDFSPDYAISKIEGSSMNDLLNNNFYVVITEAPKTVTLTYEKLGKVNVKYVDEARNPLTPPTGAPTLLTGEIGKSKEANIPSLLPDYEISSVEGATLSGNKLTYLVASLTDADQTVTLVYKVIPKEVKMTVKYKMSGTTNGVIDLATKATVADVVKTVTIGQPISGYADAHKVAIDGYAYNSVTGNAGNVPDQDFEVTYYYEGQLSLEKVPDKVDFGQIAGLISFGKKDLYPETPIKVGILDTRDSTSTSWELQLRVTEPMKTASNQLLNGSLKFNQGGTDITLTDVGQVIRKQGSKVLGREDLTWSSTGDKGLFLEQQPSNLKDVVYEGKLAWQLTDGL